MRNLSIATLSVTFLLAAVACGKSKLDHTKLESSISDGLKSKSMPLKSVSCPPRDIKQGDKFDCEGMTNKGDKVAINVEQTDDQGNITWKTTGAVMSQSKLAAQLAPNLGKNVVAKCPDETVVVKKGLTFSCDATLDGKPGKIDFTAKDDEGNFDMSAKPNGGGDEKGEHHADKKE